ncbi:MAG: 3-deoxy-D-manno-octulosonic acid transferase, partial [Halieaceae bacterium]
YTSQLECKIVLANARMSARSAAGYARVSALTGPMLQQLTAAACQSQADADRLAELGLPGERLQVTGSIKFDLTLDETLRAGASQLRNACGDRPVLVAASTHPGEDEQLLAALSQVRMAHPDVLLVLVPRHPERFDAVASLCEQQGFRVTRRSSGAQPDEGTDVYLGDTMGELVLLLGMADIAFVGGSLIEHGGHNVLEPAAWGVAVVTGPHTFNFAEISERLVEAKAMWQLAAPADLPACLVELLNQADDRQRMGRAALEVLEANRGARERLLSIVESALPVD